MNNPIVIFDGVCNLCNATVDFLITHDRTSTLRFTSFQGKGAELLVDFGIIEMPVTIYVIDNNTLYSESTAILYLTQFLPFPYRMLWYLWSLGFLSPLPPFLRNALYRLVARNRYRWFGERVSCRTPTTEEQHRFLN
ncbi:MAG: DUF393 domain-containing protein [Ignavibacteria bacterium]|nr:DUF393 domain-containing protein [Ignavibacteria bacterium]